MHEEPKEARHGVCGADPHHGKLDDCDFIVRDAEAANQDSAVFYEGGHVVALIQVTDVEGLQLVLGSLPGVKSLGGEYLLRYADGEEANTLFKLPGDSVSASARTNGLKNCVAYQIFWRSSRM